MAELSVQRRQLEGTLPGSLSPLITPSLILPLLGPHAHVSGFDAQPEKATTNPSPSATSTATTTPVTLSRLGFSRVTDVPPTSTTSGSTLPTILPNFSWSNFPSTIDTCTSATLSWEYAGPQETLQFLLVSNASPHTLANSSRKRAGNSTTLATGIDASAASWTWSQVNFTAGQYVVEAYGTGVTVTSSTFTITKGADTSCLPAAFISATVARPFTPLPEPSSSPSPAASAPSRKSGSLGVIAGGTVAGIVGLMVAFVAHRIWTRRRRQRPTGSRNSREAVCGDNSLAPRSVGTHAQPLPPTHPLDSLSANMPLIPNRRPPSSLLSAEPDTPISSYAIHARTQERGAASLMDVSTVGSRWSAALSDTTSTAGLRQTFSSCPPSYTTRPSPPPSYTTDKTRSTATTPSSERFGYTSWS